MAKIMEGVADGGNNLNRTTHHSLQLNCEAGTLPEGDGGPHPKSGSVGQTTGGIHGQTTTASQRGALGTTGTVYTGEGWG